MSALVSNTPKPERLLDFVLGYNAVLEFGAGFLFMFRPTMVYPKASHDVVQVSGFLANALLCIGILSGLVLYLKPSLRIKRVLSMALLVYNAILSWMLIRVVILERKKFDAAAMSMTSHIIATILFAVALYRTQNIKDLTQVAKKVTAKVSSVEPQLQKEA